MSKPAALRIVSLRATQTNRALSKLLGIATSPKILIVNVAMPRYSQFVTTDHQEKHCATDPALCSNLQNPSQDLRDQQVRNSEMQAVGSSPEGDFM